MKMIKKLIGRRDDEGSGITLCAPVSGRIVPLSEVNDQTFSERILGDGLAIRPSGGRAVIVAPSDGVIEAVAQTGHAVSMTVGDGIELLIHVGIDTVELDGRGFSVFVSVGERVKCGDRLLEVELDAISKAGYDTVTPLIVTGCGGRQLVSACGEAEETVAGTPFLRLL